MRKIEAFIRAHKLEEVMQSLLAAGVQGVTVSEVTGFGKQRGTKSYRGTEFTVDAHARVKMELVIPNRRVSELVETIERAAKTDHVGDGRIFVVRVLEAVRIRTGERGRTAIDDGRPVTEGRPLPTLRIVRGGTGGS